MNTELEPKDVIGPGRLMDVRELPCSIKHGLILRAFLELPVGDHFILCNGRDPQPLHKEFSTTWPDAFSWEYLLRTPEEVRVKITRLS